ncbi:MAG: hypothetical protein NZV14_09805 [Bryobacteraceae bacterium]|nr:hypothetical protein [Bryobacteraceae bacterium]MDW8378445.1 hypothetical protein [Bryobacterales bacterium]
MPYPNMLGSYGEWAASLAPDPPRLSFRRPEFKNLDPWRKLARERFRSLLLQPPNSGPPKATVQHQFEFDGLVVEHLSWQLPYGPPTEAVFLKPVQSRGKLPAILGLHDHGGNKYFGYRKITRISAEPHPMMLKHQAQYYGGLAWANEAARRGYAVLVHDTFTFGSRRIRYADLPEIIRRGLTENDPEQQEEIDRYNRFAADHEHLIAKSLTCAGLTWPGIFVNDDQRALDYLCSRPDVDPARVACCGLSGGGLRTIYLTGADERIQCACVVGMMTTWRDYLLNKCYTHTWMIYVPALPLELDYPEILALACPKPVLVLNNRQDRLFTMAEMERADQILAAIYRKARASSNYKCIFYDGPHKFDAEMQKDAFEWMDRWLKS